MKTKKRREQFVMADVLFEMGMDFDVIEKISGVNAQELLLNKINYLDFDQEVDDNIDDFHQESRIKGKNKRDSNLE
jgi:hypothetical protein